MGQARCRVREGVGVVVRAAQRGAEHAVRHGRPDASGPGAGWSADAADVGAGQHVSHFHHSSITAASQKHHTGITLCVCAWPGAEGQCRRGMPAGGLPATRRVRGHVM